MSNLVVMIMRDPNAMLIQVCILTSFYDKVVFLIYEELFLAFVFCCGNSHLRGCDLKHESFLNYT